MSCHAINTCIICFYDDYNLVTHVLRFDNHFCACPRKRFHADGPLSVKGWAERNRSTILEEIYHAEYPLFLINNTQSLEWHFSY